MESSSLQIDELSKANFDLNLDLLSTTSNRVQKLKLIGSIEESEQWPRLKHQLTRMPRLTELDLAKLTNSSFWTRPELQALLQSCPNLDHLFLDNLSSNHRRVFLEHANSNMILLDVQHWIEDDPDPSPSLIMFKRIKQFGNTLTHLSICGGGLKFDFWAGLQKLKQLRTLRLHDLTVADLKHFDAWYVVESSWRYFKTEGEIPKAKQRPQPKRLTCLELKRSVNGLKWTELELFHRFFKYVHKIDDLRIKDEDVQSIREAVESLNVFHKYFYMLTKLHLNLIGLEKTGDGFENKIRIKEFPDLTKMTVRLEQRNVNNNKIDHDSLNAYVKAFAESPNLTGKPWYREKTHIWFCGRFQDDFNAKSY